MHEHTSPLFRTPVLTDAVHEYSHQHSAPLPSTMIAHRSAAMSFCSQSSINPEMMTSPLQSQFLHFLTTLLHPKRVLEIGTFTGVNSLVFAAAGAEVTTLDLKESSAGDFARKAFKGQKVRYIEGPALDSLAVLEKEGGEGFGIVFVDADKEGYRGYIEKLVETGLLVKGGVVIVDNTLQRGLVTGAREESDAWPYSDEGAKQRAQAIEWFNDWVVSREDLEVVMLPVFDGVTLIKRKGA